MSRNPISCTQIISLLNQEPLVYHAKLGAFHSEMHQHEKAQLLFAENGLLHLHIGDKKLFLPSWYCAWIPANTPHQIWSNSPGLYIRSIHLEVFDHQEQLLGEAMVFPASNLLKEMIIYSEKWNTKQGQEGITKEFFYVLQGLLPEEMAHSRYVCLPTTTHEKLAQVIEHLQAHLQQKHSMRAVAKIFGFSERSLSRLFSSHLGISFSAYLKMARMIKAVELIENDCNHVSQIAFQVGYESLSTFSNNFLETFAMRPLDFINKRSVR
jgi:AraC-like DNA-binding protein